MSAQVVIPTKLPQHRGATNSSSSTSANNNKLSSSSSGSSPTTVRKLTANRFQNRWKPPRKPEIQVDKNELKQKLTPLQYKVTQEKFTERPFSGEYVRLNDNGIYCCVVCGEELFSSDTKYDSGCGWPAFFNTIDSEKLILQTDLSHVGGNLLLLALNQDLARTEVTCAKCGSHLGHVFDDGPKPTGKRYCVNSASLKFKKANGEEVICDIPTNGSCCFRSPTKSSSSTALNNSNNDFETKSNDNPDVNPKSTHHATNVENSSSNKELSKSLSSTDNTSSNQIKAKPALAPKPRYDCHNGGNNETANNKQHQPQVKTKSLSPSLRRANHHSATINNGDIQQPTYSSTHAKRVQMNKEDFFKSMSTPPTSNLNRTKFSFNDNERKPTTTTINSNPNIVNNSINNSKPVLNRIKKFSNNFEADSGTDLPSSTFKNDVNNNKALQNKYSDVKSRYLDHLDSLSKRSVIKHTFPGMKKLPSTTIAANTTNNANVSRVLESDL